MTAKIPTKYLAAISRFLGGAAVAFCAVLIVLEWTLICGTTVPSTTMLFLSIAAGALISGVFQVRAGVLRNLISACLLLGSALLFAALLGQSLTLGITWFPNSPWLAMICPAVVVMLTTTVTVLWGRSILWPSPVHGFEEVDRHNSSAAYSTSADLILFLGLASGFLLPLLHGLAPIPLALPATVLIVLTTISKLFTRSSQPGSSDATVGLPSALPGVHTATLWLSTIGIGVLCQSVVRYCSYQFAISALLLCMSAALTSVVLTFLCSRIGDRALKARFSAVICLLFVAAIPWLGRESVILNLHLNAGLESGWTVLLLRCIQMTVLFSTLFAVVFSLKHAFVLNRSLSSAVRFQASTVGLFSVGVALGMIGGLTDIRVTWVSGVLMIASPALLSWKAKMGAEVTVCPPTRSVFAALGLCLTALVAALPVAGETSMLLFTSHSAQAWRLGFRADQIAQTHSMRLLEQHQTSAGRLSVWRTSGDRIQMRRDGIPTAEATSNAYTSPQPITDSLTALLPLVLHRKATSALLLGDDSGAGLRVCSDFPLHTIEAVRADAASTEVARRIVWDQMRPLPAEDNRISIRHESAEVSVRRTSGRLFDVVISATAVPSSVGGQSQFTQEFYLASHRRLEKGGIFCQRIPAHEFGSDLLLRTLFTLSDIFDRVLIIRMAPGELAVVAGGPDLLDESLLQRMQKSHVATALSRSGWDWSQVAALPVVDTADPFGIFEHVTERRPSTAANGYFAFALPNEIVRNADKAGELMQTFAPHQQRLADAAPPSPAYAEFARRYSSVVQQAEILTAFPDIPWPYRKSLKMEMQRNPRPPVERVSAGNIVRDAHPLDEHRKQYFLTLAEVLQQARNGMVDPQSLRELTNFTSTYEPLLSHFAHHELVRIHEVAAHPGPALELRHRLHTVYFTESKDVSIRQVTGAIQQILDDPELLATDALRFDHVNSMLQELVRRWEGRRGTDPSSARRTQRDVVVSMQVAGRALQALEEWAPSLEITSEQIRLRRRFVNMKLVAPLREYREQVLAHRIRTEAPVAEPEAGPNDDALSILLEPESLLTN